MKTLFITYVQEGTVKKAAINESRYAEMQQDSTVSSLIVYPTQMLQETNYATMVSGRGDSKRQLLD